MESHPSAKSALGWGTRVSAALQMRNEPAILAKLLLETRVHGFTVFRGQGDLLILLA